ncbi:hypothetical protein ACKKBG_A20450 [Auxenochlorella protothecoides x Auxenochlorella symbiontica]
MGVQDPDADAGHGNRDDQGTWYGEAARRTPKLLELPLPALSLIFDIAIKRHRIEARFLKSPAVRSWEKDPRNTLPLLCKSAPAACLAAGLWHDLSINLSSITAYRRPVFEGMIAARLGTARALDVSPPARVSFGIGTWNAWLLPHLTASAAPALQRLTLYYLRPEDLNIPQLPGSVEALALRFQGSAAADEDMLHQLSRLPHLTSLDIRVTWPTLQTCVGLRCWPPLGQQPCRGPGASYANSRCASASPPRRAWMRARRSGASLKPAPAWPPWPSSSPPSSSPPPSPGCMSCAVWRCTPQRRWWRAWRPSTSPRSCCSRWRGWPDPPACPPPFFAWSCRRAGCRRSWTSWGPCAACAALRCAAA